MVYDLADDLGLWEDYEYGSLPAVKANDGAKKGTHASRLKKVKGFDDAAASAAAEARALMEAEKSTSKGAGGGKAGKGKDAGKASAGKEAGKGKGKGKRRRRGKRGKGKGGEGEDYDYLGDDDNTSFPMKVIDRMQDIHLLGGSFIESVGKSIGEGSKDPVVDNLSILDGADGVVLTAFLFLFCMVMAVLLAKLQRVLVYFIHKWLGIDPYALFEDRTDCTSDSAPVFHKVLFFPDEDDRYNAATGEPSKSIDVKKTQAYRVLRQSIMRAKSSIMCVLFVLTCRELAELLVWAKKERRLGVFVLTDEEMAKLPQSFITYLTDNGVNVKVMRSGLMIHHHYAIVDSRLLFNGSFNWTKYGAGFNFETMVITNDPGLVIPYRTQMSKMGSQAIAFGVEPERPYEFPTEDRPPCADFEPSNK